MGITGLLPLLQQATKTVHLSDLKGLRIGIDTFVWLHRGIRCCAYELATDKPTTRYVKYCMDQVKKFKHFGITPLLVFDGGHLPSKAGTEEKRRLYVKTIPIKLTPPQRKRKQSKDEGIAHWNAGRRDKAMECFQTCVDVTPEMAYQLIKELKKENVEFIVAPYEADAQLAFLEKIGWIDAILTEDSDLLVFGCQRVLFKLSKDDHTVDEIQRSRFSQVSTSNFALGGKFTDEKFRWMCILSGCDYLKSIDGMGLKTAYKHLAVTSSAEKAILAASLTGKMKVPPGYMTEFQKAENTFLYQRVYCPKNKRLVTLNQVPEDLIPQLPFMDYIGKDLEPEIARGIAHGELNPFDLQPFEKGVARPTTAWSWGKSLVKQPIRPPLVQSSVQSNVQPIVQKNVESQEKEGLKLKNSLKIRPITVKQVVSTPSESPFFSTQPMAPDEDEKPFFKSNLIIEKRPKPLVINLSSDLDEIGPLEPVAPTQIMTQDEPILLSSTIVESPLLESDFPESPQLESCETNVETPIVKPSSPKSTPQTSVEPPLELQLPPEVVEITKTSPVKPVVVLEKPNLPILLDSPPPKPSENTPCSLNLDRFRHNSDVQVRKAPLIVPRQRPVLQPKNSVPNRGLNFRANVPSYEFLKPPEKKRKSDPGQPTLNSGMFLGWNADESPK